MYPHCFNTRAASVGDRGFAASPYNSRNADNRWHILILPLSALEVLSRTNHRKLSAATLIHFLARLVHSQIVYPSLMGKVSVTYLACIAFASHVGSLASAVSASIFASASATQSRLSLRAARLLCSEAISEANTSFLVKSR